MPLRARDVFLGKIAPYFVVATLDLALVLGIGVWLSLWQPFLFLGVLGAVVVTGATLRFRRDLAPAPVRRGPVDEAAVADARTTA